MGKRGGGKWKVVSGTVFAVCAVLATFNLWHMSDLDLHAKAKYPWVDGDIPQTSSMQGNVEWKGLPSKLSTKEVEERAHALVLGAMVGDAAAAGMEGVKGQGKIKPMAGNQTLEFADPQLGPFCDGRMGDLSPFGEEAFLLLKSVVAGGGFDPHVYAKVSFEDATVSDRRLSNVMIEFLKKYRQGYRYPHSGVDSFEANSMTKAILLVALYGGRPELEEKVRQAAAVHQTNKIATDAAVMGAKFLEGILLGYPPKTALELSTPSHRDSYASNWATAVERLFRTYNWSCSIAAYHVGNGCYMPATIQTALYCSLVSKGYRDGVRKAIKAGGCASGRAMFVGAYLAMRDGVQSIPHLWTGKVIKHKDIATLTEILVRIRGILT